MKAPALMLGVPPIDFRLGLSGFELYLLGDPRIEDISSCGGKPLSLNAQFEGNDSEDVSIILDYLGDRDRDMEGLADKLDLEAALGGLDSTEHAIIYWNFYSGLTQSAISQRLGISQMHVSRLQRNALSKLKRTLLDQSAD